ncbi:MAG TPA: M23 family metallopeptidase [Pyrinomonadaceae bacterium]|nr:M23 family metallopeptidase [Pyrinomonadaceae bacterium]
MARMNPRVRVFVIAAISFAAVGALVWFLSACYSSSPVTPVALPSPGESPQSQGAEGSPTASTSPSGPQSSPSAETPAFPSATPDESSTWPPAEGWTAPTTPAPTPPPQRVEPPANKPTPPPSAAPPAGALLIPVQGIRPEQLTDTFTQSRSEGRTHNAIDIIAPRGTPVVAAAEGRVVKLFNSVKGGITVYQLGADEKTVYYYAHLDRYADNLKEGQLLRQGETLGYVGDTGNSGAGNYHLHFAVWLINDPKRYWDGANLNPYPLLTKR